MFHDWKNGVCVRVRVCLRSNLRQGFLVLDLAGPQEPQHIFGPLSDSMFHPVVMPQLLNTQLHPTEVLVTCSVEMDRWRYCASEQTIVHNAPEAVIPKDAALITAATFIQLYSVVWSWQVHVETSVCCFGSSVL